MVIITTIMRLSLLAVAMVVVNMASASGDQAGIRLLDSGLDIKEATPPNHTTHKVGIEEMLRGVEQHLKNAEDDMGAKEGSSVSKAASEIQHDSMDMAQELGEELGLLSDSTPASTAGAKPPASAAGVKAPAGVPPVPAAPKATRPVRNLVALKQGELAAEKAASAAKRKLDSNEMAMKKRSEDEQDDRMSDEIANEDQASMTARTKADEQAMAEAQRRAQKKKNALVGKESDVKNDKKHQEQAAATQEKIKAARAAADKAKEKVSKILNFAESVGVPDKDIAKADKEGKADGTARAEVDAADILNQVDNDETEQPELGTSIEDSLSAHILKAGSANNVALKKQVIEDVSSVVAQSGVLTGDDVIALNQAQVDVALEHNIKNRKFKQEQFKLHVLEEEKKLSKVGREYTSAKNKARIAMKTKLDSNLVHAKESKVKQLETQDKQAYHKAETEATQAEKANAQDANKVRKQAEKQLRKLHTHKKKTKKQVLQHEAKHAYQKALNFEQKKHGTTVQSTPGSSNRHLMMLTQMSPLKQAEEDARAAENEGSHISEKIVEDVAAPVKGAKHTVKILAQSMPAPQAVQAKLRNAEEAAKAAREAHNVVSRDVQEEASSSALAIKVAEEKATAATAAVQAAKLSLQSTKKGISQAAQKVSAISKTLDDGKTAESDLNKKVSELKTAMSKAQAQATAKAKRATEAEQETTTKIQKLSAVTGETLNSGSKYLAATARAEDAKHNLHTADAELKALQTKVDDKEKLVSELTTVNSNVEKKQKAALEEKNSKLESEKEARKTETEIAEKADEDSDSEASSEKNVNEAKAELDVAKKKADAAKTAVKMKEKELDTAKAAVDAEKLKAENAERALATAGKNAETSAQKARTAAEKATETKETGKAMEAESDEVAAADADKVNADKQLFQKSENPEETNADKAKLAKAEEEAESSSESKKVIAGNVAADNDKARMQLEHADEQSALAQGLVKVQSVAANADSKRLAEGKKEEESAESALEIDAEKSNEANEELKKAEAGVEDTETKVATVARDNEKIKQEEATQKELVSKDLGEIQSAGSKYLAATARAEDAKHNLHIADAELKALRTKVNDKEKLVSELTTVNSSAEKKQKAALEEKNSKLESEKEARELSTQAAKKADVTLESKASSEKNVNEAKAELDVAKKKADAAKTAVKMKEKELDTAKAAVDAEKLKGENAERALATAEKNAETSAQKAKTAAQTATEVTDAGKTENEKSKIAEEKETDRVVRLKETLANEMKTHKKRVMGYVRQLHNAQFTVTDVGISSPVELGSMGMM